MDFFWQLAAMAFSAFTSATVLPGTSEAAFLALAAAYPQYDWALWISASTANTVGSVLTYAMGRLFPLRHKISEKAAAYLARWGVWTLLLAWVPLAGDALCLAAGSLKLPFWPSTAALAAGKILRYGALLATLRWVF
ncbi:MAG: DedA family protein [Neisseria sp.]|nr:DedA family protein [Neisseria sp.]